MIKTLLGGLSFLVALVLGWAAINLLFRCILPWRKAPDTTHVTWIFARTQFTGWQLFVPFIVFIIGAVMITILGVWILKARS